MNIMAWTKPAKEEIDGTYVSSDCVYLTDWLQLSTREIGQSRMELGQLSEIRQKGGGVGLTLSLHYATIIAVHLVFDARKLMHSTKTSANYTILTPSGMKVRYGIPSTDQPHVEVYLGPVTLSFVPTGTGADGAFQRVCSECYRPV